MMGLTNSSTGKSAANEALKIRKNTPEDKIIALAGNPNVGKSTVFNALTGMKQHTGNWPGKTVSNAQGYFKSKDNSYILVDIPGTYSLIAHSSEEEVARNFICFENPDAVIVVCDASCLERNLNLLLQIMEIHKNVILCVNLMDEARKKGISIDIKGLSEILKIPVISTIARKRKTLDMLTEALDKSFSDFNSREEGFKAEYPKEIECAMESLEKIIKNLPDITINPRWLGLKLLEGDRLVLEEINRCLGYDILKNVELSGVLSEELIKLSESNINSENLKDIIVSSIMREASEICKRTVSFSRERIDSFTYRADKILTGKYSAFPIMLLLLAVIFWLTLFGANYLSDMLSDCFLYVQDRLTCLFDILNAPAWLHGVVVMGIYRVLSWVVSVMLPPMAIFFPLFTILEDFGYLPRIAYNLDLPFKKCSACGKQALTMCMGFGCNAAGVVGCRIIASPRERLLAVLTNNFIPCNGRFPILITIISVFFAYGRTLSVSTVISVTVLTAMILLAVCSTFIATKILSKTLLKGIAASFTLELPPYRRPQLGKILIRSLLDRTLFVLGRAAAVAAPAGLLIWILANIYINDIALLKYASDFVDPFARLFGLDGVILIAFVLGFPANEIVIPIMLMIYMSQGVLTDFTGVAELRNVFTANGWNLLTAVNVLIFTVFHWPCSTTMLTIKKETGSVKWMLLSALLPTVIGLMLCMMTTLLYGLMV